VRNNGALFGKSLDVLGFAGKETFRNQEGKISIADARCLELKYFIRRICGSPARWYGLENSNIVFEYVPLFSKVKREHKLTRVTLESTPDMGMSLKAEKQHERIAEIEEDDDIFSAAMHKDRIENAAVPFGKCFCNVF